MSHRFRRFAPGILLVLLAAVLAACSTGGAAPTAQPAAATAAPAPGQAATEPPATATPTEASQATSAPAATEAPTTAPAAAAVSYANDVQPVFERSCVKCHGGSDGTKGGLSLKTYSDLMKGGEDGQVIVPGDAMNSSLVKAIASGEMPKRAPKLPQAQIDLIASWVAAGAENN